MKVYVVIHRWCRKEFDGVDVKIFKEGQLDKAISYFDNTVNEIQNYPFWENGGRESSLNEKEYKVYRIEEYNDNRIQDSLRLEVNYID